MVTRTDIAIDYVDSPRVLEVVSPSTVMSMQDLVDTARKLEDSFQGMSHPKLVDASGKQDLGGGVSVGITVAEQNMRLGFEGRLTPAETGTVTSVPGSPITGRDSFIDAAADFVTANVERGSLVVNFTDQSLGEVISRTSATQLVTKTLVNGLTNLYSTSDVYHVFNVTQCFANGGNLTAVDDMDAVINAVQPTPFTQVVVQASSSATQVVTGSGVLPADIEAIKDAIYDELLNGSEDFRKSIQLLLRRAALDKANPLTIDESGNINATEIDIDAETTGVTPNRTTTQTRQ
jgi:hypothetical protein